MEKLFAVPVMICGFMDGILRIWHHVKHMVSASKDGLVVLWKLESHKYSLIHTNSFWCCMAFSPDGNTVVGGKLEMSGTNYIHLWSLDSDMHIEDTEKLIPIQSGFVHDITFINSNSEFAFLTSDGNLQIYDMNKKV